MADDYNLEADVAAATLRAWLDENRAAIVDAIHLGVRAQIENDVYLRDGACTAVEAAVVEALGDRGGLRRLVAKVAREELRAVLADKVAADE